MTSRPDTKKPADLAQFRSGPADEAMLRERIEAVLRGIYDPEIPVSIFELGLIYSLEASADGVVDIKMTLTAPNCPAAGAMPTEVESKVRAVEGVTEVRVELVWDPPWDKSRMSEAARLELGLM
jgi:FeS assembly SUF system protein